MVFMQGWLETRGKLRWKRRYVKLSEGRISMFEDDSATAKPKGQLFLLPDTFVENILVSSRDHAFRVVSGSEQIVLAAPSEGEYHSWRQALTASLRAERRSSFSQSDVMERPVPRRRSSGGMAATAAAAVAAASAAAAGGGGNGATFSPGSAHRGGRSHRSMSLIPQGVAQEPDSTRTTMVNDMEFTVDAKYTNLRLLGSGSYGMVVSAEDTTMGNRKVAIKKIKDVFRDLVDAKRIIREIRVLRHLHHPNLVRLRDAIPPDEANFADCYIVMEHVATDLHRVIHSKQPLTKEHHRFIMYQMFCGLNYLHSAGLIHRDIKPSNVLINANCDIKLCDFGLTRSVEGRRMSYSSPHPNWSRVEEPWSARSAESFSADPSEIASPTGTEDDDTSHALAEEAEMTEYVVTRWYRAPEVMLVSGTYDTAIDVWALGCVYGEMVRRDPVFPGSNYIDLLKRQNRVCGKCTEEQLAFIRKDKAKAFMRNMTDHPRTDFSTLFAGTDPDGIALIDAILCTSPIQRINVTDALEHPFFTPIRETRRERTASSIVSLADIERTRIEPTDIRALLLGELMSVRYNESAGRAQRRRSSRLSDPGNKNGAPSRMRAAIQQALAGEELWDADAKPASVPFGNHDSGGGNNAAAAAEGSGGEREDAETKPLAAADLPTQRAGHQDNSAANAFAQQLARGALDGREGPGDGSGGGHGDRDSAAATASATETASTTGTTAATAADSKS